MPLTHTQMDRKIEEHFGYEAADNVEGVLKTLTPDVVHDVVGLPEGPSHGHAEARRFYERLFKDLAESHVHPIKRLYGENFLVDESLWEGRAPGKPFGIEGRNRELKFRLLHVVEFDPSGLIKREQVWLDIAAILRQLSEG